MNVRREALLIPESFNLQSRFLRFRIDYPVSRTYLLWS